MLHEQHRGKSLRFHGDSGYVNALQCCLYAYIAYIVVNDTKHYVEIDVACGPSFNP
jgi:hypothetical protein